jgi:hypothetical protein
MLEHTYFQKMHAVTSILCRNVHGLSLSSTQLKPTFSSNTFNSNNVYVGERRDKAMEGEVEVEVETLDKECNFQALQGASDGQNVSRLHKV